MRQSLRRFRKSLGVASVLLVVLSIGGVLARLVTAAGPIINLTPFATTFNNPIGIDYQDATAKLIASVNWISGTPNNFDLIDPVTGAHTQFSTASALTDEIKLTTVHTTDGGFAAGDVFAGNGVPGQIMRISASGAIIENPWLMLPGEQADLRGSIFQDRYGSFGGDLIVVTGNEQTAAPPNIGNVWRIKANKAATLLFSYGKHLEGLTTVPNDPVTYGPLAGRILAGDEDRLVNTGGAFPCVGKPEGAQCNGPDGKILAIGPDGSVISLGNGPNNSYHLAVPISPEDLDLVRRNATFFGVAYGEGKIMTAPASDFNSLCGSVLITSEFPFGGAAPNYAATPGTPHSGLFVLRWTGATFDVNEMTLGGAVQSISQWEHVTFAGGIDCKPPMVKIIKFTNGADANDPTAAGVPNIAPGGVVTWTYQVTNSGTVPVARANVVVTDNTPGVMPFEVVSAGFVSGDANLNNILDPGEVWLYSATGIALNLTLAAPAGVHTVPNSCTGGGTQPPRTAYTNIGTVTIPGGTASDPSSYCNPPPVPNVAIIKFTNGADANDPNSNGAQAPASAAAGSTVTWTYRVTNTGNVAVARASVVVTDNVTGVTPTFTSVITGNGDTIFDPGEVWLYTATGTALNLTLPGPTGTKLVANSCSANGTQPPRTAYTNIGTVTIPGATASDPSSYCNPPAPKVTIIKYTNGADANDPNAAGVPNIAGGALVTWTYRVTNTGNVAVPRANVLVTDNTTGVTPTFTSVVTGNADTIFDPGEVWLYTATGTALNLLLPAPAGVKTVANSCTGGGTQPPRTAYTNIGTVTIPGASATDPSSYCNPPTPGVIIIKYTNGADANDPNAAGVPVIAIGGTVTWTYRVTNTGNVAVPRASVAVTDNTTGVTPTFTSVLTGNADTIFDPGEVWLYTATGTAVNLASPPAAVHTVPNSCTAGGANLPSTAYTNVGKVTIPGASATDPSSYCNPPPCVTATFDFTGGNSSTKGTAGNIRTFSAGGVSVHVSAFGETKPTSGTHVFSPAYLGSYGPGLGVTDSSEDGNNNTHIVDNNGQNNYVLMEFSQSVTVNRAFLDYVVGDSDVKVWIGTVANAYTSHQNLNAALLSSLGFNEVNLGSNDSRWADVNAGSVTGNVLVVAAKPDETGDGFKLSKVDIGCAAVCKTSSLFTFTGDTAVSGTAGNTRTFTVNGVSVKASAFSRNPSNGSWGTAYLGLYGPGLGVTNSSENGSNNSHKVDNLSGRIDYVLFEFSSAVVVNRAFLDSIGNDSDITVWLGNKTDPFNNHLTLSDSLLSSLSFHEDNLSNSSVTSRWADVNAGNVSGNVLVIAALPSDSSPEDEFKISKLDTKCK